VDVDQFYGIEIEEFPAQIAQVALWLMDHQMNTRVGEQFGEYFARLPLVKSATIVHGNALRIDWNEVVPKGRLSYILGNPPFVGKKEQSREQKEDLLRIFPDESGAGVLDFVACWFLLAARYMQGTSISCAFVSTNSITQGEQVAVLWSAVMRLGVSIGFAHRTFRWSNEARGNAAVFCVIIGFGHVERSGKVIFDYAAPTAEPLSLTARSINPYLVDADFTVLPNRKVPICAVPPMSEGSALIDDGHLVLSPEERENLVACCKQAIDWIRPLAAGSDFINGNARYCLWLGDASPGDVRACAPVRERVEKVRQFRLASQREATRKLAQLPMMFGELRQPVGRYIMLPKTSSERRSHVPMGYLEPEHVVNNTSLFVEGAAPFHFGVLMSAMHMSWLRAVGGRLKSDYRYSAGIVYNNFPWPETLDDKARSAIETAAQAVLDARAAFPDSTLADLYDPLSMPPALVKAHQQLDRAVDAAYTAVEKAAGRKAPKLGTDAERVAFLFERYQALTSLLPAESPKRGRRKPVAEAE
jgi:hypothetical protein